MIIEVLNNKNRRIGSVNVYEFDDEVNDMNVLEIRGDIDVNDSGFDDIYDTNDRKLQISVEASPFDSMNHESCVSPLEQELGAYKALKKSYLNGNYNDCSTLINYYFGHIDYGIEFDYDKSHGEICLILYNNLLYSIQHDSNHFIDFINRMIGKIEWNLEHKEFLEKNWY